MKTKTPNLTLNVDRILKKKKGSPCGCCCTFVKIDDNWGVKLYWNEDDRNHSYRVQKYCSKRKLAPKVGECLKIGQYFAYITEVAETPMYEYKGGQKLNLPHRLFERYEKIGLSFWDNHGDNIGRLKDGRYVAIDFGDESMSITSNVVQKSIDKIPI